MLKYSNIYVLNNFTKGDAVIMKKWIVHSCNKDRVIRLSDTFKIPRIAAMVLDSDGYSDEELDSFFSNELMFSDPFLIKDMDKAVERINEAIESYERICVYGDYDADGVTSTAILYSYLENISADVIYYIPDRETEGYGLNNDAIDKLSGIDIGLIITVDNGVSAYNEIKHASELGIDVIVTDHHTVPEKMPEAVAILNPHRSDDESPYKDFSGVGVVFKLIMAMEKDGFTADELLDIYGAVCAVGTIGDVVNLTGENRLLVKEGLERINQNGHHGLAVLRNSVGYGNKKITSTAVAFNFVPKINACGRLEGASTAVDFLLSEYEDDTEKIVSSMIENNRIRKEIERKILSEAIVEIESDNNIKYRKIIVVSGKEWHPGVIGIVAARIKDIYGKPAMIITVNGEDAKGSGRSIEGFSMCDAVTYCKELLTIFGGHPMAAGWSMPASNIDKFRDMVNAYADNLTDPFYPILNIAFKFDPYKLTIKNVEELSVLEPFGTGNPSPIFGIYGAVVNDVVSLSGGKHLKIMISRGNGAVIPVLCFNRSPEKFPYLKGDTVNLAVSFEINEYNNKKEIAFYCKDICFSNIDYEKLLKSKTIFEEFRLGKTVSEEMKKELSVSRQDFVVVYKFLKQQRGFHYLPEILYYRLKSDSMTYGKLLLILEVLKELELITMEQSALKMDIKMVEKPKTVDIFSASVLKGL